MKRTRAVKKVYKEKLILDILFSMSNSMKRGAAIEWTENNNSVKKVRKEDKRLKPNASCYYKVDRKPLPLAYIDSKRWEPLVVRALGDKYIKIINKGSAKVRVFPILKRIEASFGVKVLDEANVKSDSELVALDKDLILKDQPCRFVRSSNVFYKESEAEEAMKRDINAADQISRKLLGGTKTLPKIKRFQVRIARDIPGKGALKSYMYIYCSAVHSREHNCDGSGVFQAMIGKTNEGLYEVVREGPRRHYFDIEWEADERDPDETKIKKLLKAYTEFWGKDLGPIFVTNGSREKGDKYKHSYHVIYRDLHFRNKDEHLQSMRLFTKFLSEHKDVNDMAVIADHKKMTVKIYQYAFDGCVYTKNRLMRLCYQCKPNMSVPLMPHKIEGFECLEEPILITATKNKTFASVNMDVVVTKNETLAEIHKDHFREVYSLQKKTSTASSQTFNDIDSMLAFLFGSEKPCFKNWRDIPAKKIRKYSFTMFFQLACAIIDVINPTKEDVVEWFDRTNIEKSESDYELICSRLREQDNVHFHLNILEKYGLSGRNSYRVNKIFSECFEKTDSLPMYFSDLDTMPEFVKRNVDDYVISLDPEQADIITGKMGSGKTRKILNTIKQMPLGSRVLYIVGRVKLTHELKQLALDMGIHATIGPYPWTTHRPIEDEVVMELTVINSINKCTHGRYDMVVIDECETTVRNLDIDDLDVDMLCHSLYTMCSDKNSKLVVLDAMYTMPCILFFNTLWKYGRQVIKEVSKEMNLGAKVTTRGMDLAKKNVKYTELIREGQNTKKQVIPLFNDFHRMRIYNENLLGEGCGNEEYYGNVGMLLRIMYNVLVLKERVVVAVPSKAWGLAIENMFKSKNMVSVRVIDKNTRSAKSLNNLEKVDVLVYTSTISAGHSIEIKNHFHSIFLVVAGIGSDAKWNTPAIDECIQMSTRVRYPITNKLYFCVDIQHRRKNKVRPCPFDGGYLAGNNVPYQLLTSGRDFINKDIARLTPPEFEELVSKWLLEKAFPGSVTSKPEPVHVNTARSLCVNLESSILNHQANLELMLLWASLKEPEIFLKSSWEGNKLCIERKEVPLSAFDSKNNYTKKQVASGLYVITSGEFEEVEIDE